jgi:MYXO-CTERM domain-containing protein
MMNTRLLAWLVAALGVCTTAEAQVVGQQLFDQNNGTYSVSVYDIAAENGFAIELADDFVVPTGQTWTPKSFAFDVDTGTGRTLNIQIRSNSSSAPGATALTGCSATGVTASVAAQTGFDRATYTPTWNCTLTAGTYWLWAQVTSGSSSLRWRSSSTTANTRAKARPTGGSWGSSCDSNSWINIPSCVKVGNNTNNGAVDFLFTITGDVCTATDTTCDGVDDNCTGGVDEGAATTTFYADVDDDTYGDANAATVICAARQPADTVTVAGDCDDNASAVNPAATEVCNEIDDNCTGGVDEGVQNTYYADADNDTFGDANSTTQACSVPTGYSDVDTDCDDNASTVNPDANESCNLIDDNCNLDIDEGVKTTFYADVDSDTFGDANSTTEACSAPTGYVGRFGDCNDQIFAINPDANESCNEVDDNCNLDVDEGVQTTFYADGDNDTFGDSNSTTLACTKPTGYADVGGDCDNGNAAINPDANESCNEVDDNCNLDVDEGVTTTYYADDDADGYGDANDTTQACSVPTGYSTLSTDCNDDASTINPGETDLTCDDVDDDCSGAADDGNTDGDAAPDCDEECDTDEDKTAPGVCGCGLAETETQDPACGGGDADGDELSNEDECADPTDCQDTDGDETPDFLDTDSDGDGELDSAECDDGVCDDSDADGLTDQLERSDADSDGDGTRDQEDDDSDNDGDDDGDECFDNVCLDGDGDGIRDHLDDSVGDGDLDDDTIADSVECATQPCGDTDDDGIPDYGDTDSDNDKTLDGAETGTDRTDPCKPNPNAVSCLSGDFDGDGVPNSTDVDPLDACQPNPDVVVCATGDADDDGTPNGTDSAPTNACDPNPNALACPGGDTDGDTVPNSTDSAPRDPCLPNADAVACAGGDYDKDGAPNSTDSAPTDACIPSTKALTCATGDSDEDGTVNGTDTAPQDPCLPNANAIACGTGDADQDGTSNVDDTAPLDPCVPDGQAITCASGDTDGDGSDNGVDPEPADPCSPNEDAIACPSGDSDGDSVPNGKDPEPSDDCKPIACEGPGDGDAGPAGPVDTDGDGRSDDEECDGKKKCPDTDGDGKPDNEDEDDDGDGIPSSVEIDIGDALGLDDDIDGDGLVNWLDPDSDGDGIADGDEVADRDGDGIPDQFDADKVKLSGGSSCHVSTSTGTDLASWPLLSLLGLLFWRRRRAG